MESTTPSPSPLPNLEANRRRRRSILPYEATRFFLRTLRYRRGLRAVALGDDDGVVVAGSGERHDLEHLAYLGALSRVSLPRWRDEVDAFAAGLPFFSLRLELGGRALHLSGVGNLDWCRDEIEQALRRILEPQLVAELR